MCQDGEITGPRREAIRWDNNVRKALALCNDLVPLHRSVLAGSQDEKQAFKSVEASFVVRATQLLSTLLYTLYSLQYSILCTLYTALHSVLSTLRYTLYTLYSVHYEYVHSCLGAAVTTQALPCFAHIVRKQVDSYMGEGERVVAMLLATLSNQNMC